MDRYSSTLLPQDDTKEENQKATLDLLAKINAVVDDVNSQIVTTITTLQNSLVPVGFTYTQLPGMSDPSALWPFGTWSDISSTYAGAFFRAEGGSASSFGAGVQLDALQGHRHWVARGASAVDGSGPPIYLGIRSTGVALTSVNGAGAIGDPETDGVNGTPRTASETRPRNYTVRIWRRTA